VDLQEIRERIDDIDHQILRLLHERMELGLRTARLKAGVRDRSREADVLEEAERYARSNKLLVSDGFVRGLFDDIIRESRRIQESDRPLAGLPGEHGSRAEPAAPDVPVPGILQRGGPEHEDRRGGCWQDGTVARPGAGPETRRLRV
jgi:chorismate mutase